MSKSRMQILLLSHILFLIFISGCINLEQTTKINENGSGTIMLHYWTKTSNLSMGDDLGGLSFSEDRVRQSFTSPNTKVTNVNIESIDSDSTTHIRVNIDFNDFNRLPEARGFSKTKTMWDKGKDSTKFSFAIEKDSVNVGGMNNFYLEYKFEFPDEVVATNGLKVGKTAEWKIPLSDLKEKVVMSATIKSEKKICGLFGYEFLFMITALFYISKRNHDKTCKRL